MSTKTNLIKNITSLGIVQIANLILPLISIPIISRIIGPDKFGVVNYAATFISYFTLLIDYGFNLTATRRVSREPENKKLRNVVFSEILQAKVLLFLLSVLIFIGALYIVEPLSKQKTVAVFTFLICISTVLTQNWFFQAMQDLSKVALFNFLSKLLFTIIILFSVRQKEDYIWIPLVTSIVAIIVAIISFYWVVQKYEVEIKIVSLRRLIELLKEERVIFFSTVVVSLYTTTNVVILGMLQSEEEVGYYTAAQKLIVIAMGVINLPLMQAFYPFIGKAFGESKSKGMETVHKLFPLIFIFTGMMSVGMLFFGRIVVELLYGEAFIPSIQVFNILTFIPFIVGLSNVFGIQIMLNLQMDRLFFYITSGGAVLGIFLNVIMTKWLGNIGTAWNWILVECYITLMMYVILKKRNLDPIDWKQFHFSALRKQIAPVWDKIRKRK